MGSSDASASSEVAKLKNHLSLLREEYVKLQGKYNELERKHAIAVAANANAAGGGDGASTPESSDTFVAKLLNTVANLFDRDDYSDIDLRLAEGKRLKGEDYKKVVNFDLSNGRYLCKMDNSRDCSYKTKLSCHFRQWQWF